MADLNSSNDRHERHRFSITVAMTALIAAVVLIATACNRKPVMAHAAFRHMPASGWLSTLPLTFVPEFDDSTASYALSLAVRHDNSYRYRNLALVVDVIAADSTVSRHLVNMELADEFGNWTGGGFGALYQKQALVYRGLVPREARSVVVWQAMSACDTLCGIVNVGIILKPL